MNKNNEDTKTTINNDEFDAVEQDAVEAENVGLFTYKFRKPFEYMGKKYVDLTFDWESLNGYDGLNIEQELQALGITVVAPEFSGAYQIRMAAKACTEKIGSDAFELMPLSAYNQIRRAARNFLLTSD